MIGIETSWHLSSAFVKIINLLHFMQDIFFSLHLFSFHPSKVLETYIFCLSFFCFTNWMTSVLPRHTPSGLRRWQVIITALRNEDLTKITVLFEWDSENGFQQLEWESFFQNFSAETYYPESLCWEFVVLRINVILPCFY